VQCTCETTAARGRIGTACACRNGPGR
jgi:hypothetical protein